MQSETVDRSTALPVQKWLPTRRNPGYPLSRERAPPVMRGAPKSQNSSKDRLQFPLRPLWISMALYTVRSMDNWHRDLARPARPFYACRTWLRLV